MVSKIGYKVARSERSGKLLMVKLAIPDNAKTNGRRSSIVNRRFAKLRCNRAKVLDIYDPRKPYIKRKTAKSDWNSKFMYIVGETVKVDDYNDNISVICAPGIHYFETEEAAREYGDIRTNNVHVKRHNDNGRIVRENNYVDDTYCVYHGKQTTYDCYDGNITSIENYKNGKKHSAQKYYYNGKLNAHYIYKDGNLVRQVK